MDKIYKNINNLISLWTTVGRAFDTLQQRDSLYYSFVPDSDWPNRVWSDPKDNIVKPEEVMAVLKENQHPLKYSHWSGFDGRASWASSDSGFKITTEQVGMSLELDASFPVSDRLQLVKVVDEAQAKVWEELFPQSFNYKIAASIILKTQQQLPFYLILHEQKPIGTAITLETDDVIGIHGLGIIPEYRRRGLAEEVMAMLMNDAMARDVSLAVLQASAMGKNIYSRMGFKDDFLVSNYALIS